MNRKWTYDKIKHFVEIESNSGCTLIGIDGDATVNCTLKLICKCGDEFSTKFKYFKSTTNKKTQCTKCGREKANKDKMLTIEDIKKYVDNNSSCVLLSKEYNTSMQKLKFKCSCGNMFFMTFPSFKNSNKICHDCAIKNMANNQNTPYDKVKTLLLEYGYVLLTTENDYINLQQNLSFIDSEGYKYYAKLAVVRRDGTACRFSKKNIYTIDNLNLWIQENRKDFILISKEFIKAINKLKWKCDKCGCEWDSSWANISTGCGCPVCASSKGEQRVDKFFKENNIHAEPQKTFDNLTGLSNGLLSYDFYLFQPYNILIEYDGEFHYKPIPNYKNEPIEYSEQRFRKQQIHDKLKDNYARDNNIKLIRIPYYNFEHIEEILCKELNINNPISA